MNKEKLLNYAFWFSTYLLLLFFITSIINVLEWVVGLQILMINFPLSLIITYLVNYKIHKMKFNFKQILFTIFFIIILIILSLIISNKFLDISYDGSWYHLTSIIKMKNGWNPIYGLIESGHFGDVFIDSYASKAIWSFGAVVYSFFGNLNFTKIISTLIAFSTFFMSIYAFGNYTKNKKQFLFITILSLLIAFNPIYLSQMFTNYIDSTLGLLCIIYILLFILLLNQKLNFNSKLFSFLISVVIALMMNVKLTGLFFAATFFLVFVIFDLVKIIKNKDFNYFKKIFLSGFLGLVFGVIIGINPYITNIIRGHHIFYPIMGENKIEVMGANVPERLRGKGNIEKIFRAHLSNTSNSVLSDDSNIKNPFQIKKNENIIQDTRMGSFGPIFPLIIYTTFLVCVIFIKEIFKQIKKKEYKSIFISLVMIWLIALIFPESWWGRYYVVLYLIPIFMVFIMLFNNNLFVKISSYIILTLFLLNSLIVFNSIYKYNKDYSLPIKNFVLKNKGKDVIYNTYDSQNTKFELSFEQYFNENKIKNKSVYDNNIEWDFINPIISIKVVSNGEYYD